MANVRGFDAGVAAKLNRGIRRAGVLGHLTPQHSALRPPGLARSPLPGWPVGTSLSKLPSAGELPWDQTS